VGSLKIGRLTRHTSVISSDFLRQIYLQSSEVDNTINVGMRSEDVVQCHFICDVDLVEVWSLAAEEFDAVEGDLGGIVQIIDYHDFIAMFKEGQRGE
jgi:hypothetical protein